MGLKDVLERPGAAKVRFKAEAGIREDVVRELAKAKGEPEWMVEKRLEGLRAFREMPLPSWGPDLTGLDLEKIHCYVRPDAERDRRSWDEVPEEIKETFEKLGIPEAERKVLAGVGAQYESEVVYHRLKKRWEEKGVVFLNMDEAVQQYPDMVRKHFMTSCTPVRLHAFTALHAAVWSGGSFIYVPKGVKVTMPLQAYFRMNEEGSGQFEHTLIIVDEGAEVQYIEGCSAPIYATSSLHAGCVEIFVKKGARMRYSSIENWSKNVYNLNTKRALVEDEGVMEWVNGNMGSCVTMLYPCSILKGARSKSEYLGIAFAGSGQEQDTGAKMIHIGRDTSSVVVNKSMAKGGGVTSYRGAVQVLPSAVGAKASVSCDTLLLDGRSVSNTYPSLDVQERSATVVHEATTGRIDEEVLRYVMTRGVKEEDAVKLVVAGFIEPVVRELPLEYAVELNRLIELEMEGLG